MILTAAIIPVKSLQFVKQRLAARLSSAERQSLIINLLRHELCVLEMSEVLNKIFIVTPDPRLDGIAGCHAAIVVRQRDVGLNNALELGRSVAREAGIARLLVLLGDLPFLAQSEVQEMIDHVKPGTVVLAPDRRNQGTNAMGLAVNDAMSFAFGINSFAEHQREAHAANLEIKEYRSPGVGFDIDTPSDLDEYLSQIARSGE